MSELGPALDKLRETFPEDAARAREMLHDPSLVREMDDHATLYGAYEAFGRLDFLTGSGRTRQVHEMSRLGGHADLTDDLREVIGRLAGCGIDVIVVDQTVPEHAPAGLRCVKVLLTGAVSMTFGHQHRRTQGIPRLAGACNPPSCRTAQV